MVRIFKETPSKKYHLLLLLLLTLFACSENEVLDGTLLYEYQMPVNLGDGWDVASASQKNINEQVLTNMVRAIEDNTYSGIDSVVVIREGSILLDRLFRTRLDGSDPTVGNTDLSIHSNQSTSKSFVSAMMGIAIDQGIIGSVDDVIWNYFPEYPDIENWNSMKAEITIRNLLTMRHGLEYDEWSYSYGDDRNTLSHIYATCPDLVKCVLDLPMQNEPGTTFVYSTAVSVVIGAIIENAAGIPLEDFADLYLFDPLGITTDIWAYTAEGHINTGGGLYLSSRDMARLGQLFLDNGEWQGTRLISETWVTQSTATSVDVSHLASFRDGYGFQWWIQSFNVGAKTIATYSAEGNGGQFIYVVPEFDMVVVFTGANYNNIKMRQPEALMRKFVLAAVN